MKKVVKKKLQEREEAGKNETAKKLGAGKNFGREKGRKSKPPQERRARKTENINWETSKPVKVRYTDHFYAHNENSDRLPLTVLLQQKLERVMTIMDPITGEERTGKAKDLITDNILELASQGDKWAIELILNRIEGKSVERVDMGGGNLPTSFVDFLYGGSYGNHKDENGGL